MKTLESNIRVLSHATTPFANREEAGALLAKELEGYRGRSTIVLGVPRGGMIVARKIAQELGAELDVVLSRKLGAPGNPEFAIGAVAEDGKMFLDLRLSHEFGERTPYVIEERNRQVEEIKRRIMLYRQVKPKAEFRGKTVIVTDDGIATGATMLAALWSAKQSHPKQLVVALPVAPEEPLEKMSDIADEVICLRVPPLFMAVGQFYYDFAQVDDNEVVRILKESQEKK